MAGSPAARIRDHESSFTSGSSLKPYILHTDVSDVGVEATLSQLDAEGIPRLVACRSRKRHQALRNYPVREKETFALVDALDD